MRPYKSPRPPFGTFLGTLPTKRQDRHVPICQRGETIKAGKLPQIDVKARLLPKATTKTQPPRRNRRRLKIRRRRAFRSPQTSRLHPLLPLQRPTLCRSRGTPNCQHKMWSRFGIPPSASKPCLRTVAWMSAKHSENLSPRPGQAGKHPSSGARPTAPYRPSHLLAHQICRPPPLSPQIRCPLITRPQTSPPQPCAPNPICLRPRRPASSQACPPNGTIEPHKGSITAWGQTQRCRSAACCRPSRRWTSTSQICCKASGPANG